MGAARGAEMVTTTDTQTTQTNTDSHWWARPTLCGGRTPLPTLRWSSLHIQRNTTQRTHAKLNTRGADDANEGVASLVLAVDTTASGHYHTYTNNINKHSVEQVVGERCTPRYDVHHHSECEENSQGGGARALKNHNRTQTRRATIGWSRVSTLW